MDRQDKRAKRAGQEVCLEILLDSADPEGKQLVKDPGCPHVKKHRKKGLTI
jgi:hypothetical protein